MTKIVAMCHVGISRSVGLVDVLKLHFEPVDAIPIGHADSCNSPETKRMLFSWADWIVVMEDHYRKYVPDEFQQKVLVCEVGPDVYGHHNRAPLIDKCWRWVRAHQELLGIKEYF
jgi:predicted protein tyrosine phosphatase